MKVSQYKGIIHFQADSQYELASTFMRLQEFYESPLPNIRGNVFTLEEYMDAYAKEYGDFTYTSDWNGFNVPGNVVGNFFHEFKDLLVKEQTLRDQIEETGLEKFYVIGTHGGQDCEDHEICHALWYLHDGYAENALELLSYVPQIVIDDMKEWLLKKGYDKSVLYDEINAYFSTDTPRDIAKRLGKKDLPWNDIMPLHFHFHETKKEFFEEEDD